MESSLDYIRSYPAEPSSLIPPLLQRTQERFGYLPPREALEEIADYLGVPLSRVYGVATFYAQFRFEPPLGKYVVRICHARPAT